ncbi:MAG: CinA family protein [Amylibacter sp.]|nr:CinA family protein [Amylibacter sp.]
MTDLARRVLQACRAKGWILATAESCTGGMVAAALTQIAGSSDVVDRGFVTYSNNAKMQMLGVLSATLDVYGAVSNQVAYEMATGALNAANVDIAVAITGIAGPGPSAHKPEGRVCFALAQKGRDTHCETVEFGAIGRENVRLKATEFALGLLLKAAQ